MELVDDLIHIIATYTIPNVTYDLLTITDSLALVIYKKWIWEQKIKYELKNTVTPDITGSNGYWLINTRGHGYIDAYFQNRRIYHGLKRGELEYEDTYQKLAISGNDKPATSISGRYILYEDAIAIYDSGTIIKIQSIRRPIDVAIAYHNYIYILDEYGIIWYLDPGNVNRSLMYVGSSAVRIDGHYVLFRNGTVGSVFFGSIQIIKEPVSFPIERKKCIYDFSIDMEGILHIKPPAKYRDDNQPEPKCCYQSISGYNGVVLLLGTPD